MKEGFMPVPVLAATDLAMRLRAGEAAVIPTDTLPGLAVLPDQAQTLWRLKRRPADKPLILMGPARAAGHEAHPRPRGRRQPFHRPEVRGRIPR